MYVRMLIEFQQREPVEHRELSAPVPAPAAAAAPTLSAALFDHSYSPTEDSPPRPFMHVVLKDVVE